MDEDSPIVKDYRNILEDVLRGPVYTEITLIIRITCPNKKFDVTLDRVEIKGLY